MPPPCRAKSQLNSAVRALPDVQHPARRGREPDADGFGSLTRGRWPASADVGADVAVAILGRLVLGGLARVDVRELDRLAGVGLGRFLGGPRHRVAHEREVLGQLGDREAQQAGAHGVDDRAAHHVVVGGAAHDVRPPARGRPPAPSPA